MVVQLHVGISNANQRMPLANAVVGLLAEGKAPEDLCGLLLIANWPPPATLIGRYEQLQALLAAALPACAYLYPPSTLHCTVTTLRPFTGPTIHAQSRRTEADRWRAVLAAARADPAWPEGAFRLRLLAPTLEGAAAIVKYDDVDGHIDAMRACVRRAILDAGGVAAEGGGDRSKARALPGAPAGEPPPHIPDIVHSTVLRWAAEPTADQLATAKAAFARAAASWEPFEMTVEDGAIGVFEDVPFMHVPHDKRQVFWRSTQGRAGTRARWVLVASSVAIVAAAILVQRDRTR